MDNLNLIITNPDEVVFEGSVNRVIAPGLFQDMAILPEHTPLYAQLKDGDIEITLSNNQTRTFAIDGGVIRVKNNKVSIIVGF